MNAIIILGFINLILLIFQILSGLNIIKTSYKVHKISAFILLTTVIVHATFAIYEFYFD